METILGWLAGKIAGPVFACMALLGIGSCTVQTVRLDGVHLFGWTVHEGALDREAANLKSAQDWQKRADAYSDGLDKCNGSIDTLHAAGKAATDRANALLAQLDKEKGDLVAARKRLAAVPKSDAVCPSVTAIFNGAFQP